MHISYESYFLGRPWATSLLGFAFAAVAAFCAVFIGRTLPRRFRLGFALISLIVVLGSGINELFGLVFYDVDSTLADAMAIALTPVAVLPFIGELAYPFILSIMVIWAVRADTSPAASEQETMPPGNVGSHRTDPAIGRIAYIFYCLALLLGVVVTAFFTFIFFSPVTAFSDEGWDKEFELANSPLLLLVTESFNRHHQVDTVIQGEVDFVKAVGEPPRMETPPRALSSVA